MKCLDSDILIAILRGNEESKATAELLDKEANIATTAINAYEIIFGAKNSAKPEHNLLEAKKLLKKLDVLSFTIDSAEKAGELQKKLLDAGQPVDIRDVFIASVAMSYDCTLITRNQKHFSRMQPLRTEKW